MRGKTVRIKEKIAERVVFAGGVFSIVCLLLIFIFVVTEGLPLFGSARPSEFFFGTRWQPTLPPPTGPWFGLLPSLWGSVLVTMGAALLAVPLGIACAVYISEVAPPRIKNTLKVSVEMLALIPSVALGFIGAIAVNPLVRDVFHLDTGKSAMAGSLMLALIAVPTIVSVADDGLRAVPNQYRDGTLALGSTRWQGIWKIVMPSAMPSMVAAAMLGVGRAVGETMAVIMVTGNASLLPDHGIWYAFTHSVRTITGTIGSEAMEVANGEPHYHALFMLGVVLFTMTLLLNLVADFTLRRKRRQVMA